MTAHRSIFLCLLLTAGAATAQTMYVTDELVITLRTGPSTQNAIIDNLNSGERVEVLEQNADNGYSRVRVADSGDEGWVLTRFLLPNRTAALDLSEATRGLNAANARIQSLESELETLKASLSTAQSSLASTESSNSNLTTELESIRSASANAIQTREQNESLRRRNNELNEQVEALTMQNAALSSRSNQNWFVVGALVFAAGIVVGLVAPSLRRKRRSSW